MSTTESTLEPVEVTNKYDLTQLRNAVDDELSRYYSEEKKYTQSHIHTDFKLVLGFVSCFIAGGAFLYEYKTSFNEAFSVTTVCVIVYWILQSIGFAYSHFIQKDEIFIGTQKLDGKAVGVLKISGKIEKHSPVYQLELQYIDKSTGKKAQHKITPNITTWFNSTNTLNRVVMDKDLDSYLSTVKGSLHKN